MVVGDNEGRSGGRMGSDCVPRADLWMKYQMNNGIRLEAAHNPSGGTSWFADAGPEGKVLVWDTAMVPVEVLLFCVARQLDPPKAEGPKVHLDFNPNGWRR